LLLDSRPAFPHCEKYAVARHLSSFRPPSRNLYSGSRCDPPPVRWSILMYIFGQSWARSMSQGQSVAEAIRAIGVTELTYYRWRQEYGGLRSDRESPDAPRQQARPARKHKRLAWDRRGLTSAQPAQRHWPAGETQLKSHPHPCVRIHPRRGEVRLSARPAQANRPFAGRFWCALLSGSPAVEGPSNHRLIYMPKGRRLPPRPRPMTP
jgi:hypothetical protein